MIRAFAHPAYKILVSVTPFAFIDNRFYPPFNLAILSDYGSRVYTYAAWEQRVVVRVMFCKEG
jgi:hypothetical protein